MPRIVETVVYEIKELSGAAKERARAWYRESCLDYDWHEFVYDDFEAICGLLGVTLETHPVPLMGGGTREKPQIFYSGFSSQGDGASFSATYEYASGAARAVRAHAPRDTDLHAIADTLQEVQQPNFYQLSAGIRQRGRYCHEYTMAIDVERDSPTWQPLTDGAEDTVIEAMRDLARWLYRQLEREYDYRTSDEVVDETLAFNEWTFTEAGVRFS
ncbi:MAG: antitoxin of toxin-antitoxin stability system [Rhodospirillaceae bacterium]|nr:antitoxin of toxin-antitoxin stability system [Rhodospirillaceae bacterium]MYI48523.1 antitoxin of toxin-antitoxin stability system [Rhodospirillaceae bacterium]